MPEKGKDQAGKRDLTLYMDQQAFLITALRAPQKQTLVC